MKVLPAEGLLDAAKQMSSPNFDERPDNVEIDLLVIHGISLPPGEFGGEAIEQFFTNTLDCNAHPFYDEIRELKVSPHLLIRRNGELMQYVPFQKRAWHAGASQFQGRSRCNDFSIGIELEGSDDIPYEEAQYRVLIEVVRALRQAYPAITSQSIVGHCHIAPGRKTDPGDVFDWPRLRAALQSAR